MHPMGPARKRFRSNGMNDRDEQPTPRTLSAGDQGKRARLMQFPRVPVVAAGDVEVAMVEEFGEHVDRDARIGVPLGVGGPGGGRDSAGLAEFAAAALPSSLARA